MHLLFDYGHGGTDPGATYKGRKEADDVLRLGQAIAKLLRQKGIKIDETRSKDSTLTLQKRVEIEHKKQYDYFISFHRNAFKPEAAAGAEVFVFSTTSKAKPLADNIQKALVNVGFKNRGVKTADFYVLKHTKAPAILLEVGFIDHTADNLLFDQQFNKIATAIANAILNAPAPVRSSKCPTCGR